jgi:hypothetical protein
MLQLLLGSVDRGPHHGVLLFTVSRTVARTSIPTWWALTKNLVNSLNRRVEISAATSGGHHECLKSQHGCDAPAANFTAAVRVLSTSRYVTVSSSSQDAAAPAECAALIMHVTRQGASQNPTTLHVGIPALPTAVFMYENWGHPVTPAAQ